MIHETVCSVDPSRSLALNSVWQFGGNTCHAPLWLRDDLCRHLEIVRDRLGFRYVRAYGPIGDGMKTIGPDGQFNFAVLLDGLDRLLDRGFKPFLELSHMPGELACNDKAIAKYRFRSAPPKDWTRWFDLIDQLMKTLVDRYGIDELEQWYFEV